MWRRRAVAEGVCGILPQQSGSAAIPAASSRGILLRI